MSRNNQEVQRFVQSKIKNKDAMVFFRYLNADITAQRRHDSFLETSVRERERKKEKEREKRGREREGLYLCQSRSTAHLLNKAVTTYVRGIFDPITFPRSTVLSQLCSTLDVLHHHRNSTTARRRHQKRDVGRTVDQRCLVERQGE